MDMKRTWMLLAAAALAVGLLTPMAVADDQEGPPPHAHMMIQGAEGDGDIEFGEDGTVYFVRPEYRKCVDLAANRTVPLHAHHAGIHTGRAGWALNANTKNFVIPTAPLSFWDDCADLAARPRVEIPAEWLED
jgi:hypothetical protein